MKNKDMLIFLVILSGISLAIGARPISLLELLRGGESEQLIFIISRVPRLMSIILTGSALSVSGLIMQQITRNKFVSPTTAATMDSTKMGILFAMVFLPGVNILGKMSIAFLFSLLGTFLFMSILKKVQVKNVILIPLIGIMLGNVIDSITTFIAYRMDLIQNVNSWLQGSFSMVTKGRYEIIFIIVPLGLFAYVYANKFTIAGMGQDFSKNLGLNHQKIVNIGLVIVALISSAVMVTIGNIPFVGLIIPNIVSILKGDHLQNSLFTTALLGAVFLLSCDILGRLLIYPYEISISLTAGVMGSLIFLYLIFKGVKK